MKFKSQNRVYIIAEIGVNHNGKISIAKKLIDKAKKVGADAVKFQLYSTKDTVTKYSYLAPYQKRNTKLFDNQYDLLLKYEIKKNFILNLKQYCKKKKIDFLVSVFDTKSLKILEKLKYKNFIKIPSGEIINSFLLKSLNINKHKLIISTGMSNNDEIVNCLNLICKKKVYKLKKDNSVQLLEKKMIKKLKNKIFLLHCVTDYSAKKEFLNLNIIHKMSENFKLVIGFSDHSSGINASVGSVYAGAKIIEKHITLDKKSEGPDHLASSLPQEFKIMVERIREAELILGNNIKKIQTCEIKNKIAVRKSIVAKKNININNYFTWNNLTSKRTKKEGLNPMKIKQLLNKKAKKNFLKDELIFL
jgi:sialic acid synthase SpsE